MLGMVMRRRAMIPMHDDETIAPVGRYEFGSGLVDFDTQTNMLCSCGGCIQAGNYPPSFSDPQADFIATRLKWLKEIRASPGEPTVYRSIDLVCACCGTTPCDCDLRKGHGKANNGAPTRPMICVTHRREARDG